MANEIQLSATTGLTPSIQLYSGLVAFGAAFGATEIGTTGEYVASVPALTPYGRYLVIASDSGNKVASGELLWDGKQEILVGLSLVQGMDPNNPATTTQTTLDAGTTHIDITGDGVTSTTFTRND